MSDIDDLVAAMCKGDPDELVPLGLAHEPEHYLWCKTITDGDDSDG